MEDESFDFVQMFNNKSYFLNNGFESEEVEKI
jgi:hypothetical protein